MGSGGIRSPYHAYSRRQPRLAEDQCLGNVPGMTAVREAALNDVPELSALVEQYWKFESILGYDYVQIVALLERLIRTPSLGTIWVAQCGSKLVGYLIAVFIMSVEHRGLMAEIDEFFVVLKRVREVQV